MATTRPTSCSRRPVWAELVEQGRIVDHPVFPGRVGPGARRIADEDDVRDVIALMRLNYDRIAGQVSSATRPDASSPAP